MMTMKKVKKKKRIIKRKIRNKINNPICSTYPVIKFKANKQQIKMMKILNQKLKRKKKKI